MLSSLDFERFVEFFDHFDLILKTDENLLYNSRG